MAVQPLDQFLSAVSSIFERVASYFPQFLVFLAISILGYLAALVAKIVVERVADFFVRWKLRGLAPLDKMAESGLSLGSAMGWLAFGSILSYGVSYGIVSSGSRHPAALFAASAAVSMARVMAGLLVVFGLSTIAVVVYHYLSRLAQAMLGEAASLGLLALYGAVFLVEIPIIGLGVQVASGSSALLDAYSAALPAAIAVVAVVCAGLALAYLASSRLRKVWPSERDEVWMSLDLGLKALAGLLSFAVSLAMSSTIYPPLSQFYPVALRVSVALALAIAGLAVSIYSSRVLGRGGRLAEKASWPRLVGLLVLMAFISMSLAYIGLDAYALLGVSAGIVLLVVGFAASEFFFDELSKVGATEDAVYLAAFTLVAFAALAALGLFAALPGVAAPLGLAALAVGLAALAASIALRRRR